MRTWARAQVSAALPTMASAASSADGPQPPATPTFAAASSTATNMIAWCARGVSQPRTTFPPTVGENSIDLPVGPRKEIYRNCGTLRVVSRQARRYSFGRGLAQSAGCRNPLSRHARTDSLAAPANCEAARLWLRRFSPLRAHCCKRHPGIDYTGLDLSPKFVELSRKKFPKNRYICADILEQPDAVPASDYIVMNGVFTEKRGLTFDEMLAYFERTLTAVFAKAQGGIAFNVMSKHVDWERKDLF